MDLQMENQLDQGNQAALGSPNGEQTVSGESISFRVSTLKIHYFSEW